VDDKELMQGAYMKAPSRSYTLWENTMCNPLGDMRTQTQSAWHDGYASAKVEKEWYGLTDEEVGMLTVFDGLHHVEVPLLAKFARAIEAKLKEKNSD
jgi:hypothetical protein